MKNKLGFNKNGFSLIEVSVTLLLLTVVMFIFYELIIGSMRASMFMESHNDLTVLGQRVVNTIQTEVVQTKQLFQEDTIGNGYRTLFSPGAVAWTDSKLPVFDIGITLPGPPEVFVPAELDPDASGDTFAGNSLLLARQLEPVEFSVDHDQTEPIPGTCLANAVTPNVQFQGDRYRFQYYYLVPNTLRSFAGKGQYLDLMEAQSQVFADYFQLNNLPDCLLPQAVDGLLAAGINIAWDPGKDAGVAFFTLVAGGGLVPTANPPFILEKNKTMLPELRGGRISGKMEYSVGYNSSSISSPLFKFPDLVPLYAQEDNNFPGGLEFKVVDNAGVKKMLTRVVLLSQHSGNMESQANFVITSYNGL